MFPKFESKLHADDVVEIVSCQKMGLVIGNKVWLSVHGSNARLVKYDEDSEGDWIPERDLEFICNLNDEAAETSSLVRTQASA